MPRLTCSFLVPLVAATAAAQLPPIPEKVDEVETPKPELFIQQPVVDLGDVIEGDRPTVTWTLENRGNADLMIERTHAGCGCTVVKLKEDQKVIPPGGSLLLKAEFHSQGRRGKQTKGITVFSNDPVAPMAKLKFTANIRSLYTIKPPGMVNARAVHRGGTAAKTIDILPLDQGPVEILSIQVPQGVPLRLDHEPFKTKGSTGSRIHIRVDESASLGMITTKVTLKLRVGDVEQDRIVPIRCSVVGDMTWTPKVLDNTRHPARGGTRLPPLTIRSEGDFPFKVLDADAGPRFDVRVDRVASASPGTRYSVLLTMRKDAPAGPFGTTLRVRTDSLDQPVIEVPVFGIVTPLVRVEPPVIVLRQDGTAIGTQRRVRLQASPQSGLKIGKIECDHDSVTVTIDQEASSRYHHLCFLDVKLTGAGPSADRGLAPGEYQATLTVTTNVKGAERLEIPIRIDVPKGGH